MKIIRKEYPDSRAVSYLSQEPAYDISMGEWGTSYGHLLTSGASTCTILAAYNNATRQGLLGHFSDVAGDSANQNKFNEALSHIKDLGRLASTDIYLAGGSPFLDKNSQDTVEGDRNYCTSEVEKYLASQALSLSQLTVEWNGQGEVVDVEINCPEAILAVHDYPRTNFFAAFSH